MALLMEAGTEPKTNDEIFDLEAISALKESAAIEFKDQGNEFVKKGKKHYPDAIDCYTRAINQKALSDSEHSILYSNRAHVNLLLGNYRRALQDAQDAIKLCPTNVKALYRAAKASAFLNLLDDVKSYCEKGLEQSPDNEELKKLLRQNNMKKTEQDRHENAIRKAVETAESIISALENRQIKIGKAIYQELTGIKKPFLDKNNMLHWPVNVLYPEVMSADIIEDFCEADTFSMHLDMMFSESSPPLPWDVGRTYTRGSLEVYYEAGSGVCLSKRGLRHYLLQGTVASHLEDFHGEETGDVNHSSVAGKSSKWAKVDERKTLHEILKDPKFIIPANPVFFVVSKGTSFHNVFTSGRWSLP